MSTAALERSIEDFRTADGPAWVPAALPADSVTGPRRSRPIQILPQPERQRSWRSALIWSVAALAAVVGGVAVTRSTGLLNGEPIAEPAAVVRTVKVAQPTAATTGSVVLPATIRAWQSTTLHARVSGYLTAWHHDFGSSVKAGDLLAEIETPELDQELAEGEALASEAAAAAVQAKAEREEARADLRVAEAQLTRIQAEAELAKTQLVRREKLLATRAIARDEYDTFATQVDVRTAEVVAATADVLRRRTNLQTRTAVIAAREATAKSRRANVDRLKELQIFKQIVAPLDGVITSRQAEVGMLVTAGKESLYTIEDMSRVRVQVNVPQSYAQQTARGSEVTVSVPESTLPVVHGTVTRTAESISAASRTMLAEIELDNASHRYQPGSYAQVSLATVQDASSWTIPSSTVSMQVDGPHVAVVGAGDQIEIRRVQLGRDLGGRVIVTAGIEGSEQLVVHPGDSLSPGMHVQVDRGGSQTEVAQR